MARDEELVRLRQLASDTDTAIGEMSTSPASTVTIDGMTVTRPSMAEMRRQLASYRMRINQLESGGVAPFDQSIRFVEE